MQAVIKSRTILILLRIVLGFVFIFSAFTKFLSIDTFELYIYSLNFTGFDMSALMARLIISFELCIGLLLIINIYFRAIFKVSLITLFVFLVFLLFRITYAENCNCFGELIALNPLESLIKNIIFMLLLWLVKNNEALIWRFNKVLLVAIVVLSFAVPIIISPPDFIHKAYYQSLYEGEEGNAIMISDTTHKYSEGKQVLVFASMGCRYCVLATRKIDIIAGKHNYYNDIVFYFFGDESEINSFWEKSQTQGFSYAFLPAEELLQICKGRLPTIYFTIDGKIAETYGYRTLTEKEFVNFLE